MRPPVFVIGAPRSGTTYLVEVLNRHEKVLLTNELRVMTYMNRIMNRVASDKWILMNGREDFIQHLYEELPVTIESFYRRIGATEETRWGDKNPHYADSKTDPECLSLIDRMYPDAQFINIVRDGRAVMASLIKRGWVDLEEAVDVWRRHVVHAAEFLEVIGDDRGLTLSYENLVEQPEETTERVLRFLNLETTESVIRFLAEQEESPTPFSSPTSLETRDSQDFGLSNGQLEFVTNAVGDLLEQLGYPT